MSRAMIEIVEDFLAQGTSSRATFEAHSEGGGSLDHLLFRIKRNDPDLQKAPQLDILVDRDDARMLFNWLGVWLHTHPQG